MAKSVRPSLAKIWNDLGNAGLTSSQERIVYLATLLTAGNTHLASFPEAYRPDKLVLIREVNDERLQEDLAELRKEAGLSDNAQMFDLLILFYSSKFVPKDAYPIPRHIIHFVLDLLDIQSEHHFADFTCGSGGFLVNAAQDTARRPARSVGVDISPDWLSIAIANAALHHLERPQIDFYLDDAFQACGPEGVLSHARFQRIAMAPPFGLTIDKKLAQAALADNTISTGASEVLFTYLAYNKLEPGGRAVVMVPISLLTNRTGLALRRRLLEERALEAVITFQTGMLQPFNNERVALLLMRRVQEDQPPPEQCWLLNLEYDGYPRNPSRDLLSPPPLRENDLPLVLKTLYPEQQLKQREKDLSGPVDVDIQHQTGAPVTLLRIRENTTLVGLRDFARKKDGRLEHFLLTQIEEHGQLFETAISLQERNWQRITDSAAWRREFYEISEDESLEDLLSTGVMLLEKATAGQQLAITSEGRLLGFSMSFSDLAHGSYSLIARDYLSMTDDLRAPVTDAGVQRSLSLDEAISEAYQETNELFQKIRQIEQVINNLQKSLLQPLRIGDPLPIIQPMEELILSYLGREQSRHWEKLQPLVEVVLSEKDTYPRPFHPQQLESSGMNQTEIAQMLQLLEHLGVVIQVSGLPSGEDGEQPRRAYRRVSKRDLFPPARRPWE